MANHTIDCHHCGEDQRLVGRDCCEASKAEIEAKSAALKERNETCKRRLASYGLRYCSWDGKVDAQDVLRVLDELSARSSILGDAK